MSFLKNALKATGNNLAGLAEGGTIGDVHSFTDTGSYALNALVSGSIYGGFPKGKISAICSSPACGKTFVLLTSCREFLQSNKDSVVFYFDSESAITKDQLINMGVPTDRIVIIPVCTIEDFRHQAVKVLDEYKATPKKERPEIFMCLDSLGMLSSRKEVSDITDGKDTRDMTKAQLVKATFRLLTLKLGELGVPMVITAHTYESMAAMYPTQEMAGGKGTIYAASSIIMLSKRKEKDGTEQTGINVRCKMYKSRFTKENVEHYFIIDFVKGMKRFSGMSDLAVECGIWKKISNKIELEDGRKFFQVAIDRTPEKFINQNVLDAIEEYCKVKFCYGSTEDHIPDDLSGEQSDDSDADVSIDQLEE